MLLAQKQQTAFSAFADQLYDQLKKEGTIKINASLLKQTIGTLSQGS